MKKHASRLDKLEQAIQPPGHPDRLELWQQGSDGLFRSDDHPGKALTREQLSNRAEGTGGSGAVKLVAVYLPQLGGPLPSCVALPDNGRDNAISGDTAGGNNSAGITSTLLDRDQATLAEG